MSDHRRASQALALREAREALARARAEERLEKAKEEPLLGSAIMIAHESRDLMALLNAAKDPITAHHFVMDEEESHSRVKDFFYDANKKRTPPSHEGGAGPEVEGGDSAWLDEIIADDEERMAAKAKVLRPEERAARSLSRSMSGMYKFGAQERQMPPPPPPDEDDGFGGLSTASTPYGQLPDNQNLGVTGGVRSALKKMGSAGMTSGVWWPEEKKIVAEERYTPRHGDSSEECSAFPDEIREAGDVVREARTASGGSAESEQPPEKPRRARRFGPAFPVHDPSQDPPVSAKSSNEMIIRIGAGSSMNSVPSYRQHRTASESEGSDPPTPKAPARGIRRSFADGGQQPATPRIPRSSELTFGAV